MRTIRRRPPRPEPVLPPRKPEVLPDVKFLRAWAHQRGIECPDSGRVPKEVIRLFWASFNPNAHWIVSKTYHVQLGPRRIYDLEVGTPLKVKGWQGTYYFQAHVINPDKIDPETGQPVEWIDVVGGIARRNNTGWRMWRAFRPGKIRTVLKADTRPTKKEVAEAA